MVLENISIFFFNTFLPNLAEIFYETSANADTTMGGLIIKVELV